MAAPGALRGPFRGAIRSPKSPKSPKSPEGERVAAWLGDDASIGKPGLGFEQVGALGQEMGVNVIVLDSQDAPRGIHFEQGMDSLDLLNAFRGALLSNGGTAKAIIEGVQRATEGCCAGDKRLVYKDLREIMLVAFSGDEDHCPLNEPNRRELRRHIESIALGTVPKLVK